MLKSYKYRIYPTVNQIKLIEQTFAACRVVYNLALEVKIRAYREHSVRLSAYDLCNQLVELKQDLGWLRDVNSQALQMSVQKVDVAFNNFYKGAGYPKFKRRRGFQSFQCPSNTKRVDFENNTLSISKIPNIKFSDNRTFTGKIKTVTISKTATKKYFASVLVDDGKVMPIKKSFSDEATIGIDLGIKDFAILSDGTKFDNPKFYKNSLTRLTCLQRRVSRKKKGSNNRKKAAKRLAVQHEKVANQRKDFLHKLSTKLISDNQAVCVESLAVANMVKNRKLSQSISDVGWSEFVRQLKYKADWIGKTVIEIGRFEPSSKTCSNCSSKNDTLTLSDREWTCASCLVTHDRDINAAKNIKFMGLQTRRVTSEEPVELRPNGRVKKQEITHA